MQIIFRLRCGVIADVNLVSLRVLFEVRTMSERL